MVYDNSIHGTEIILYERRKSLHVFNIELKSFYIGIKYKYYYKFAVHVITLYGHSCLCFMTCEAEPIMADP